MREKGKPNSDDAGHPERVAGHFYGRRKAKPLKSSQALAHEQILPQLRIDLSRPAPGNIASLFTHAPERCVLEIGFGGGEHFVEQASLFPESGFIGCEPFINGMAKAAREIARLKLSNIRLHDEDAMQLLSWLPDACLDRIYLLYPDPWPKKRHWKRRFVNAQSAGAFLRVLKPGGEFRFASDIDSYVNWTLRHVLSIGGFHWTARTAADWQRPWDGWESTRYEKKAIREGRTPAYFIFTKQ